MHPCIVLVSPPVVKVNCVCSLEENDKIKSEINPRKINEPKTPYHGPVEEEPGCGKLVTADSALPYSFGQAQTLHAL